MGDIFSRTHYLFLYIIMENAGWIKLHRKLLDNPWAKDPEWVALWIYLLMNVCHEERQDLFNGKRITLKPGQMITGRNKLACVSGVNRNKVERLLKCYENEQQIEQQTSNKARLITIKNWNQYQQDEQQSEQQVSNKRATSEQQVSTIQECKECKNEKNDKNYIEFDEFWKMYPKKSNKLEAMLTWDYLDDVDRQKILDVLPLHVNSQQWKENEGKYIPNPNKWLTLRRWEDEIAKEDTAMSRERQNAIAKENLNKFVSKWE